jgi:hypothetical protein
MKLSLVTLAVLGAIAASAAQADTFTFDPDGASPAMGAITNGALIDQAPGNALSVNGNQAVKNFIAKSGSTSFTTYYQSNLSAIQAADTTNLFSNGSGGNFFTFTAGFGENVTSAASNGSATFAFDAANTVNYFNMYATSSIANNLSGAGFASGTLILTGHVVSIPSSSFTVSSTAPVNLDQSPNGNDWGAQKTVSGSGSSDITFQIDSADVSYFPDLLTGSTITLSFLNTSLVDPFKQIDPSKCLNTDSSTCTAGGIAGNLGATNGSLGTDGGPDFQFQADANQSVRRTVPEPATIALLGLGLLAIGVGSSRRKAS